MIFVSADLRDDSNPAFAKEFYRALSVVCDDLFFARYRRSTSLSKSMEETNDGSVETASTKLLEAMFGDCHTEEEKRNMVDELLDVSLLPATDIEGVHFDKKRLQERYV